MLWHLGNTTIRTPYRLREALIALNNSALNGNIVGKEREKEFSILLHNANVAEINRLSNGEKDISDFGRKWRSALTKLGFITQKFSNHLADNGIDPQIETITKAIPGLTGHPYQITPNGHRLINSETVASQQEIFLRAILSIQLPSSIEPRFDCKPFSPLKFVIGILFELKKRNESVHISFEEFALFVVTSSLDNGLDDVVDKVLTFRKRRLKEKGSLRKFDKDEYSRIVLLNNPSVDKNKIETKAQTLDDYTDCTLRYLKATGLFRNSRRGITLNEIKEELAQLIILEKLPELSPVEYLSTFWQGSKLPTDNSIASEKIIEDLTRRVISKNGIVTPLKSGEDPSLKRFLLEEQLRQLQEIEYYSQQREKGEEIAGWLGALLNGKLSNTSAFKIPRGEAPAYFEWAIWRAFLAINSLVNHPYESRRFQIDQDFLPVCTAPGNGPDLIFEFVDSILIVEVTLTTSSRQEAAEGEPVRRHVAKFAEKYLNTNKSVYGLFLALHIDNNTAHTFRMGDWYLNDDTKINLQIVPMKLNDFYKLFLFGMNRLDQMPGILQGILIKCRAQANQDAPIWKKMISSIVDQAIKS
jgi:hypothetical protein